MTPTRGKVWFAGAAPPPLCEFGFAGFVTLIVTLPAVARSATGTVIVRDVPAAFAVPVSAGFDPIVTSVELLNPVPVSVIVCDEVAPALSPAVGENTVCVGMALSICVGASVLDLSVEFKSPGSETVAEFVSVKLVGEDMAVG